MFWYNLNCLQIEMLTGTQKKKEIFSFNYQF